MNDDGTVQTLCWSPALAMCLLRVSLRAWRNGERVQQPNCLASKVKVRIGRDQIINWIAQTSSVRTTRSREGAYCELHNNRPNFALFLLLSGAILQTAPAQSAFQ